MTDVRIAAIVEGDGEREAVPILIRRIAQTMECGFVPRVLPPLRVPASRLLKEGEIERSVELAARKLQGKGGIVIIVDCDWENGCPAKDGPALLRRAVTARSDIPIAVVLAKKEFEAWFLAAAESLRGQCSLSADLAPPDAPEDIRGAKEWLTARMPAGHSYKETTDQPSLTAVFDISAARRADSFDKCYREVTRILQQLLESSNL
jgi:hypothetical protein